MPPRPTALDLPAAAAFLAQSHLLQPPAQPHPPTHPKPSPFPAVCTALVFPASALRAGGIKAHGTAQDTFLLSALLLSSLQLRSRLIIIEERADSMEAQLSHELDEARQLLDASFARAEQLQSEVRKEAQTG